MIITFSTGDNPKTSESLEVANLSNLLRSFCYSNKDDSVSLEISNVEYESTNFGDEPADPVTITLQGDISVLKKVGF